MRKLEIELVTQNRLGGGMGVNLSLNLIGLDQDCKGLNDLGTVYMGYIWFI